MSYLAQAHSWAKQNTKTFNLIRVVPSLLAAGVQHFGFGINTLNNTLITAATLIGSYVFLYALEYTYKLVFVAPARITADLQSRVEGLNTENSTLKTYPAGPEIWLEYVDRPIVRGQLSLHNVAGGTARNVQLSEMRTKSLLSAPTRAIPFMNIGDSKDLDLRITFIDSTLSGGLPTEQFLMEAAETPISATIRHEDANGKKFSSEFEIAFDSQRFKPIISQRRRQLVSNI